MSKNVYITGTGIVSSIGLNYDDVLNSLLESKSGIGNITHLDSLHKNEIPVAEVKATNENLRDICRIASKDPFSRTALLGIAAAGQALASAEIESVAGYRTGLISATTVGGMDRSERFYRKFISDNRTGRLRDIITHDMGDSTEKIAAAFGIRDFVTTISTACSSSANAVLVGSRLIKNGVLDRVLVGGVDALTLFTINGFNSLMILDKNGCRPFDEDRNGLTLGEGAGYLVIESEEMVNRDSKRVLCRVAGYGNACDAFHQTASSPDGNGAFLSMQKALSEAELQPEKIDYINAHGTGTRNNDLSEGKAIERIFGSAIPPFSSTKSYTGHTLGAAGAIEAIFSIMAIQHNYIWPNLRFSKQMTDLGFSPVSSLIREVPVNIVLSNSFGFGGNNSSLIFSRS